MYISKVWAIYFSPVKNTRFVTKRIAESLARDMEITDIGEIDFTLSKGRPKDGYSFKSDDLVVFGTPTYAGRIPNKILPFVQSLFRAKGTPAIAIVTFGNRNFDSSLTELRDELENNGFSVFAAAGFPCQHVFTNKLGTGRPDENDIELIEKFAHLAAAKFQGPSPLAPIVIRDGAPVHPYYTPLKANGEPAVFLKAKPVTDLELCTGCGICANLCPINSIEISDGIATTPGICIKCQACIHSCPQGARHFYDEEFLSHVKMLEENYTDRKEPELYL